MTVAVVASLLLALAATGLGIEALRKSNRTIDSGSATSILVPTGGATVSGAAPIAAAPRGPKVQAVDFLVTGGSYHDTKIGSGTLTQAGWDMIWQTTNVPNGTYQITSVGYNADGASIRSPSVTVKVVN
ncbi:MAG TPA: Ig-like domain-containing protein [Acidimicrobiales bacterium]|nr:Ig-like domain-containing protein [Acidimicrobiales bacterium]